MKPVRASTGSARTDCILIKGLICRARVGVPEAERRKRQKILLDIELGLDLRKAGRSGRVQDTVDYAAIAREARKLAEGKSFILAEQIAESAAGLILKKFPVQRVKVRVRKFSVPGAESVGIEIVRPSTGSGRTV